MKTGIKTIALVFLLVFFVGIASGCSSPSIDGGVFDDWFHNLGNAPQDDGDPVDPDAAAGNEGSDADASVDADDADSVVQDSSDNADSDAQDADAPDAGDDTDADADVPVGIDDAGIDDPADPNVSDADSSGGAGYSPASPPPGAVVHTDDEVMDIAKEAPALTTAPAVFRVPWPSASGTHVTVNDKAEIDHSHTSDGYVMIRFLQATSKELRVQVTTPRDVTYTYTLKRDGSYEIFPLSGGNGEYKVSVFEQVEGTRFALANSATLSVRLNDEFAPFLRPNQYVNFSSGSRTVSKAAELVSGLTGFGDRVAAVYHFIIGHLSYDKQLAETVQAGYLPNLDSVLQRGKGICFDYAALMTAMLRSQGMPTQLVVGYAGDAYHAWINVWSQETGWVDSVIFFDGRTWNLMDPTFASTGNQSADVLRFIGDGKNYRAMLLY